MGYVAAMITSGRSLVTVHKACAGRAAGEELTGVCAALDEIVMRAVDELAAADHAGLTVVHGQAIKCLAATDVHPLTLTNLQRRSRQGPCFDLTADRGPICVDDLRAESRWPHFTAQAVANTPVRALLSQTVFRSGDEYAVFTLYADRPDAFGDRVAVDSSAFVSQLAGVLADAASAPAAMPPPAVAPAGSDSRSAGSDPDGFPAGQ